MQSGDTPYDAQPLPSLELMRHAVQVGADKFGMPMLLPSNAGAEAKDEL